MATYRSVHISFWTDPKVDDDFTPEDKYFYLYLLTNPHTNLCGCYEISMKQMTRETGYNEDTVRALINRMENVHKVIEYDRETKEIYIIHWGRYNWAKSEKTLKGVFNSISTIKSPNFRSALFNTPYMRDISGIQGVSNPESYPMEVTAAAADSVSVSDSVSDAVSDSVSDAGEDEEEMPF